MITLNAVSMVSMLWTAVCCAACSAAARDGVREPGVTGTTSGAVRTQGGDEAGDAESGSDVPRVLIIGDSVSIGYTWHVQSALRGEAIVERPMLTESLAENCEGTTKGVQMLDRWLGDEQQWDVIHFNFGLHDLKFVDAQGRNSTSLGDRRQASLETYEANLRAIVERLEETGAELIFATTTPVPEQTTGPLRFSQDVLEYNAVARRVMEEHDVRINDLYDFVRPRQWKWQRPRNVHFHEAGYEALGEKVAEAIAAALEESEVRGSEIRSQKSEVRIRSQFRPRQRYAHTIALADRHRRALGNADLPVPVS